MIAARSQASRPIESEDLRSGSVADACSKIEAQLMLAAAGGGESLVLQALIDQIPDFVFVKDLDCRFVIANSAVARAYGLSPESLVGQTDFDLHPAERAKEFHAFEQSILRSGSPLFNMEECFPDPRGVSKHYSTTKVPLRDQQGAVIGLIGIARDVTELTLLRTFEMQQADILSMIARNDDLSTVLDRLTKLIDTQLGGIRSSVLLFDAEAGRLRHGAAPSLSERYCTAIDGIEIGPSVGSCGTAAYRRESVVVSDISSDPLWANFKDLAAAFDLRSCWSTPIIGHSGRLLGTFALYASEIRSPTTTDLRLTEAATRIAGIAIERHLSELQLIRLAHYDSLTELPNRVLFMERLTAALKERHARDCKATLLYIDLNGFKQVNDQLGHYFGDLLLREVGRRLSRFTSSEVTVARLGGDEFAAVQLVTSADAFQASSDLAQAVLRALGAPFEIEGHRIVAGATIGIAAASDDDDQPSSLLRDADLALYRAKAERRGGFSFYDPELSIRAQQRRQLEIDLRRAVADGAFQLHYQPVVRLESGEVCAFEALLRWPHPETGLVPPSEFVPVAEELGLIVPLGKWVLHEACSQAARWPSSIKVAVNLSPVQFRSGDLDETVVSALSIARLEPSRLELEITESVLLVDSAVNIATLHKLRQLGVQISLDDFGIGYSSLSYLRSFPFTRIKIDRSFVQDMNNNPGCLAIARAVARLAADLGIRTTAEGIETEEQRDQLRAEGCHEGQGFLFSRAVPASAVPDLIAPPTRWRAPKAPERTVA